MDQIYVLDGGLATELERLGHNLSGDPLWSARLLHTNPEAIKVAHTNFLEAGSDFLTTASYQASLAGIVKHIGVDVATARNLISSSVEIAQRACDKFWHGCGKTDREDSRVKPRVFGSIGPYGACLHDGSEYTGNYISSITDEDLMRWHQPRLECLNMAEVGVVLIETIPCVAEAVALVKLLREFPNLTAFISFSCKDGKYLNHGELFSESVHQVIAADSSKQLLGVGINCTHPTHVTSLLQSVSPPTRLIPYIIYPNSGELWDATSKSWVKGSNVKPLSKFTPEWLAMNCHYVGGCCKVYPSTITDIRKAVNQYRQATL